MKTWEALRAADEGKKIRRRWWSEGVYNFKKESRFGKPALAMHYLRRDHKPMERMDDLQWYDIFVDDWEIYEEES